MTDRSAYVLRVSPGGDSLLDHCLSHNEVIIGWGSSELLDRNLDWLGFRQIIHDHYYPEKKNFRTSGTVSGHVWRFLREMKHDDLVMIPAPSGEFYLARITSFDAHHTTTPVNGFTHSVEWMNEGKAIPRLIASARMQSRMKVQGTTAYAVDLVEEILRLLEDAKKFSDSGVLPSFESDLRQSLTKSTLRELRNGKIDSYKMEHLIGDILRARGFKSLEITARSLDKGDDIFAELYTIGGFSIPIAVQVKHYYDTARPLQPHVVEEIISGMRKRETQYGLIVTVGTISTEARVAAAKAYEEEGAMQISFLDGEELSEEYLNYVVGAQSWPNRTQT